MDQEEDAQETSERAESESKPFPTRILLVLVVVALFAGVFAAKVFSPRPQAGGTTTQAAGSLTSVHNDAVADYAAATKTGKPIYVLFHSLT